MPDQLAGGDFSHETLDADIKRLAAEVSRQRESPESRNAGEREILKQSLRALTPTPAPQQPLPTAPQSPLPQGLQAAPPEAKLEIEYLLDMALHKGLDSANAEAAKSSPFVLDAFHDLLIEKLYPELQKRGVIK
ncbi:MAG: hypothetical protein AAB967_01055 [Patescibacteria group bacterium]